MSNQNINSSSIKKKSFSKTLRNTIAAIIFVGTVLPATASASPRGAKKVSKPAQAAKNGMKADIGVKRTVDKPSGFSTGITSKNSINELQKTLSADLVKQVPALYNQAKPFMKTAMGQSSRIYVSLVEKSTAENGKISPKHRDIARHIHAGLLTSEVTSELFKNLSNISGSQIPNVHRKFERALMDALLVAGPNLDKKKLPTSEVEHTISRITERVSRVVFEGVYVDRAFVKALKTTLTNKSSKLGAKGFSNGEVTQLLSAAYASEATINVLGKMKKITVGPFAQKTDRERSIKFIETGVGASSLDFGNNQVQQVHQGYVDLANNTPGKRRLEESPTRFFVAKLLATSMKHNQVSLVSKNGNTSVVKNKDMHGALNGYLEYMRDTVATGNPLK